MSDANFEASFDSAALLRKYVDLELTGSADDLAPHNVLGLPKEGSTEPQVLAALRARIERVQRVPASSDAEVSHVRMLLHASAAVMLAQSLGVTGPSTSPSPSLANASRTRAHIGSVPSNLKSSDLAPTTWSARPASHDSDIIDLAAPTDEPSTPAHTRSHTSTPSHIPATRKDAALDRFGHTQRDVAATVNVPAPPVAQASSFEHELFLTLALCGGWNALSQRRVQMLAAMRGVSAPQLIEALQHATSRTTSGSVARSAPTAATPQAQPKPARSPGQSAAGMPAIRPSVPSESHTPTQARVPMSAASQPSVRVPDHESDVNSLAESRAQRRADEFLHDEAAFDRANSTIKSWVIGGGIGAALLITVALTIRYTIGRTPPTPTNATATPVAPQTPQAAATPSSITSSSPRTGETASSSATTAPTAPRSGPARSVKELIAALHTAALEGGVRRAPAATSQGGAEQVAKAPTRNLDASLVVFRDAMEELGDRWISASEQQLPAISNAVLEYLYRVSDSDAHAQAALAIVSQPAQRVLSDANSDAAALLSASGIRSSVLSAGLLARLQSERDLSWSMRSTIERTHEEVFASRDSARTGAGSFPQGATAALRVLPAKLLASSTPSNVDGASLWNAWREALGAIEKPDTSSHAMSLLGALDMMLTSGIAPSKNPLLLAGYRSLTPALPWQLQQRAATPDAKPHEGTSETPPALAITRDRFLAWLVSPTVPADHLSIVLASMVDAKVPGVDLSMTLSAASNESDRALLRERFTALWGLSQADGASSDRASEALAKWRAIADPVREEASRETNSGEQPRREALVRLVKSAYANTIAWQIALGDLDVALASLGNDRTPDLISASGQKYNVFYIYAKPNASSWGIRYVLASSNAARRLEALRDAQVIENLLEARSAIDESLRGISAEHRAAGRRLIERDADNQFVLAAMLDASASAPPVADLRPLYERLMGERLPAFTDPAWRIVMRRALIRRVIQGIAKDNDDQFRDIVAGQRLLSDTYEDRLLALENHRRRDLGQAPLAMQPRLTEPDPAPLAKQLTANVAAYTRNLFVQPSVRMQTPDEVMNILSQRLRSARSRPQETVAHQLALLELQATIVASRAPANAPAAKARIDKARAEIARATDVIKQMQLCESAMLDLWHLGFGGAP